MAKEIDLSKLGRVIQHQVETQTEEEYRAFAFDVFGEVLRKTPVDTGRARANWHIQINTPDYSTDEGTIPKYQDVNADGFPNIYISNGLSYIGSLDDGISKQAPNGITLPALAAVRSRR
jgi:hypothetical protein